MAVAHQGIVAKRWAYIVTQLRLLHQPNTRYADFVPELLKKYSDVTTRRGSSMRRCRDSATTPAAASVSPKLHDSMLSDPQPVI